MPATNDGVPPSRSELLVRFVCGAALGAVLGGLAALEGGVESAWQLAAIAGGGALACGLAARQLGDRFWSEWFRGWDWGD